MLYSVRLAVEEEYRLSALVDEPLRAIVFDGVSAEIRTAGRILQIRPEEAPTPDKEHRSADVERVLIEAIHEPLLYSKIQLAAQDAGKVTAVNVVSVLITFSPAVLAPEQTWKLSGGEVVIPQGIAYGEIYYPRSRKADVIRSLGEDKAVVDLDIGIEVLSEKHPGVVLYTRGYFIQVSTNGLPDVEWAKPGYFSLRKPLKDNRI
jgi:hypothetical protein